MSPPPSSSISSSMSYDSSLNFCIFVILNYSDAVSGSMLHRERHELLPYEVVVVVAVVMAKEAEAAIVENRIIGTVEVGTEVVPAGEGRTVGNITTVATAAVRSTDLSLWEENIIPAHRPRAAMVPERSRPRP